MTFEEWTKKKKASESSVEREPIRSAKSFDEWSAKKHGYFLDSEKNMLQARVISPTAPSYESPASSLSDIERERDMLLRRLEKTGVAKTTDVEASDMSGFGRRAGLTAAAGATQWAGNQMGAWGAYYEAGQGGRTQRNNEYIAEQEAIAEQARRNIEMMEADGDYTESEMSSQKNILADAEQKLAAMGRVVNENIQEKATAAGRDFAADVTARGAEMQEEAKEGLGTFGKMLVDAGASTTQVLLDMAANRAMDIVPMDAGKLSGNRIKKSAQKALAAIPSMGVFANRAFGGAVEEARADGANFTQQLWYGGAQTAKEVATEIVSNLSLPFKGAYGEGAVDDAIEKLVSNVVERFAKTPESKRILGGALSLIASGVSEGAEEVLGDIIEWPLKKIIYDGDMDSAAETFEKALYDFGVGFLSGGIGGTISSDTYNYKTESQKAREIVDGFAKVMGEEGARVMREEYDGKQNEAQYADAMTKAYDAGLKGEALGSVSLAKGEDGEILGATGAQVEKAYRAGMEDKAKALATKKGAEYNETKNEEARDGAESVYLRNGGERLESESSRGEVRKLEESAGRVQSWNEGSRPADGEAARLTYARERVSTSSLGIKNGNENDAVYVVEDGETEATAEAKRVAKENNLDIVLFAGGDIHTTEAPDGARGYYDAESRRIYVRVDDPDYTAAQIAKHEAGHDMIARGEVDINAVRERCKEVAPNGNVEELSSMYSKAYDGLGMTADEIWEECICDSLGDMNEFGKMFESRNEAYANAMEQVRSATSEAKSSRAPPAEAQDKASRRRNAGKAFQRKFNGHIDAAETVYLTESEKAGIAHALKTGYGKIDAIGESGYVSLQKFCYLFDITKNGGVIVYEDIENSVLNAVYEEAKGGFESGRNDSQAWSILEKSGSGRFNNRSEHRAESESGKGRGRNDGVARNGGEDIGRDLRESVRDSQEVAEDYSPDYEYWRNAVKDKASRRLTEEELRQENVELREQVAELKRQFTRSKAPSFKASDIAKLGRNLVKDYDSKVDMSDIGGELQELADNLLSENYTDTKEKAANIARKIANEASVLVNGEVMADYDAIKKDLRNQKIAFSDKGDIVDFEDFRKRNFGRFTISNSGLPVDVLYEELRGRYGESYFPSDIINPADQLMHIADLLDNMQEIFGNPFSYDMADATERIANDIIDRICNSYANGNIRVDRTYADRAAERVAKAETREKKKAAKVRERLERVREDRDAKIDALKKAQKEKERNSAERRRASALREKIRKHANKLGNTLLHGTDKKHIPDELEKVVAALLEAINLESAYEVEFGKDAKFHRVKRGESPFAMANARTTAFVKLRDAYKALAGDYVFEDELLERAASLGETPISSMSIDDLSTIWDALKMVEKSVTDANKAFRVSKAKTIAEASETIKFDNSAKKDYKELVRGERIRALVGIDMLTPEAFFHRLGDMGDSLFRAMRDAQDKYIRIMKEIVNFSADNFNNIDVKALEKEMHSVTLGGQNVELSTAQLMELYVLMRRQQARGHILGGGLVIESATKKKSLFKTSEKTVRGVTLEEVLDAIGKLTPEQIAAAEKMQDFVSNTLSEYGNETSMEVFGYKKFNEEFYWTIRSAEVKKEIAGDYVKASADKGFTKATKEGAKTALKIGSIFDTFSTHSSEMAHYSAWRAVLEDLNRIRNYKHRDNGSVRWTMEDVFNKLFGRHGDTYIAKLLTDITTGASGKSEDTGLTGGLSGKYKAAAVGANLRVIIQQPTALLRAFDVIDPKWFANNSNALKGWEKAKQYAPIAQWKDWGYFDIGTGKQMKDLVFGTESTLDKASEVLMKGAAAADAISWGIIWNACEAEVKSERDDAGTDEFYKAVAKRFSEVIDKTQVVDGVLQRSQAMRNKSELAKMATSFMGEPTKQFNMLVSSIYDARNGDKAAKKKVARTAATLILSGTINALAQSIIDGLRDDERKKKYWEKVLAAFAKNEASMLNPVQYIPYAKDAASLFAGYDVSRMDMESISEIINSAKALKKAIDGNGSQSVRGATINFINDVARAFGIPAANIKRDVYSVVRTYAQESNNYLFEYEFSKWEKSLDGNKSHYISILYDAFKNDPEAYEIIYRDLVKNNAFKTENNTSSEAIASSMEKKMKEEQGVKKVSELDERYLTPDQKEVYDKTIKRVQKYSVWSKANKTQRKKAEDIVYDLTLGVGKSEEYEKIISGGKEYGLTEDEFIAYKLALAVVDEPNESGKLGTFTEDEKRDALKMLKELSLTQKEKDYLKNPSKYNK